MFFPDPPPALAVAFPNTQPEQRKNVSSDLKSIFDGILHAVPKKRRSLEMRWRRKFAYAQYFEHAIPKSNIIPCLECGNNKEKGYLCGKYFK